jgi:hypothetical protein
MRAEKVLAITDPYRPPVGAMPTDKIQLIVEGCEILPTMGERWVYIRVRGRNTKVDPQVYATNGREEALEDHSRDIS